MSNINKILITVAACVFMICVASVSIVKIVSSDNKQPVITTSVQQQEESTDPATTTDAQQTESSDTTSTTQSTTETTTAADADVATELIGIWTDSSGLSGYDFAEGGRVNWTYVNLGQFSVPFEGKMSGLYTLEGDTLTIKFSIYSATIKKSYRISINGNELSMYDLEEHETSTYARVAQ